MPFDRSIFPFSSLSNSTFLSTLGINIFKFSMDELNEMVYDPFETEDDDSIDYNLTTYCVNKPKCNYHFCGDDLSFDHPSPSLSLFSFNISSVPQHWETLSSQCLDSICIKFHVIGLCETRLNDSLCSIYNLPNYTAFHKNKSTRGGGVSVYVHENLQGTILSDMSFQLPHIECLFLTVEMTRIKCVVGMIYRPPNADIDEFLLSLGQILESIGAMHTKLACYVMGDFNVNLLSNEKHTKQLANLFYCNLFFPTITKPTRVTKLSATLIDHVWTNDMHNYMTSGVLYSSISDHFPIFSSFSVPNNSLNCSHIRIPKRFFTEISINVFKNELSDYAWRPALRELTTNEAFGKYLEHFLELYDKNFPIKEVTIKEKHLGKPYITPAIQTSIKHRNKLQKLFAKWPLTYEISFKRYRNMLTTLIRKARENHYKYKLENASDSKRKWEVINDVLGKKRRTSMPSSFTFNGRTAENDYEIGEGFNDYFCNIADTLAQSIPPTDSSFEDYLPEPVAHSFVYIGTSVTEIEEVIKGLKIASPGHDDIHIKVLKECSGVVSPFLEFIIDKSFDEGSFPDILQIAKVIPVHKKGEKSDCTNYRPIAILSTFSKIFEKIIAKRLIDYLTKYNLISGCQFGFRPHFTTELAIHSLCQNIYNALDDKLYQLTVFCDLSKAFDTIDHNILIEKLKVYGIRGKENQWFKSYLSSRMQYTVFNGTPSSHKRIRYGVPQGSIIGPILFLVFINDLPRCNNELEFLLFADDTNIFLQGRDIYHIQAVANRALVSVSNWLKSNKLTLNLNKTQFMISQPLMTQPITIDIKIDNIKLKQIDSVKFLGVVIDSQLKWRPQIDEVQEKLSKITGIVYRIRNHLDESNLRLIYFALVYPHLIYCSAIWGGACKTYIDNLFISQKKLIRTMYGRGRYDHTDGLFKDNNLLKLHDILDLQAGLFVYKSLNTYTTDTGFQRLPPSRRINELRIPLCLTTHAQHSILVRGARLWNQLLQEVRIAGSQYIFKNKLKKVLLQNHP